MSRRSGQAVVGSRKGKAYVPDRGDIVWINLGPQAGREQAGRRTCLVLSPGLYNGKTGLAVFCPITNQAKGYSFEVRLPSGLSTTGVVLADHIKSLDWRSRNAAFREKISESIVREVLDMALTLLSPVNEAEEHGES